MARERKERWGERDGEKEVGEKVARKRRRGRERWGERGGRKRWGKRGGEEEVGERGGYSKSEAKARNCVDDKDIFLALLKDTDMSLQTWTNKIDRQKTKTNEPTDRQ